MNKILIALSIGATLATGAPSYASDMQQTLQHAEPLTSVNTHSTGWIPASIRYKNLESKKTSQLKQDQKRLSQAEPTDSVMSGSIHYTEALYQLTDISLQSCIDSHAIQYNYQWVSDIVDIQCHGYYISSLEGIQNFTSLDRVMVVNSSLTDLTPLAALPQLKHIDVYGNNIASLQTIASMTQLETLIVAANPVTDLSALGQLTGLVELALPDANLNDLSIITPLTHLQFLDIGQNPIQDYSALNGLAHLKAIHLDIPMASVDLASMLSVHREWEWLGVNQHQSYCWQLDYIEKHHTFLNNSWYRPPTCDLAQDWEDFDGDGLANLDEVQGDTDALLLDTDNDGTPDGQLPGGDNYIWDAVNGLVDYSLQQCVNDVVMANPAYQYASEITTLDCRARGIHSLQGLEAFIKLRELIISENTINDPQHLSQLPELTKLEAYNISMTDISWVSSLTKLTSLWIGFNPVSDLTPLQSMTQLEELSLPDANLTELSTIANLTNLALLDLGNNAITDISALAQLTKLRMLDLSLGQIQDISPILRNGTHWEWLGVAYNVYCWQLDYVEEYNTFQEYSWYRPPVCDNTQDWMDYDGDGLANLEEIHGDTSPILFDTDNDGTPDGQLPGGDRYIWDAMARLWDYQLHMCVLNIVNANPAIQYASEIKTLDCQSQNISSLEGIDAFIGLTELELSNNTISDLTPVTTLPQLTNLFVFNNGITNIDALAGFSQLKILMLGGNPVTDISVISQLVNLESLVLPNGNIGELSALTPLTQLKFLDTENNPITDISALSQLTQVHTLGIWSYTGSDISTILAQPRHWQWLGLNDQVYCWQLDYLEKYHTFEPHSWYRPSLCDASQDYSDFDGDTIPNKDELMTDTDPLLLDTDNDGTPDGQLPGGDSYLWDAYYQIMDPALQNCIYQQMMQHPEWEFTSQLTELHCMSYNINQLTGIEKFIGLTTLDIGSNQITDLTPLFTLPNLTTLIAMSNPLSSIAGIEAMTQVEVLILFDTYVTDLSPIYGMTQLKDLAIPNANFTDMSLLNGLSNLLFLDIGNNPVTDLSGFTHYDQLKFIGLDMTQVKDISLLFNHVAQWDWIGLPPTAHCWQSKYIEVYHTFEYQWYPNASCDQSENHADYDGDGMDNWTELYSSMTDPTVAQ